MGRCWRPYMIMTVNIRRSGPKLSEQFPVAENKITLFESEARFRKGREEAHYEAIGKFVKNWAAFELFIQSAIWRFANVDDEVGYCLTAQISKLR